MNHYQWCEKNLLSFFDKCGIKFKQEYVNPILCAHGDKCYGYRNTWMDNGIPFSHGVAIYLLTYETPYSDEVRKTKNGRVDVCGWVVNNYERFKPLLNEV